MTAQFEQSTLSQMGRILQQWLFRSHPAVTDAGEQRRAQLLMAFALALSLLNSLGLVSIMTMPLAARNTLNIVAMVCTTLAYLLAYALGRSRFYRAGALLLTLALSAAIYTTALMDTTHLQPLVFIPIVLVLGNALLSTRAQLALTLLNALAPVGLAMLTPDINLAHAIMHTGSFITIGVLSAIVTSFHNTLERARRRELELTNRELRHIQVSLEERIAERTAALEQLTTDLNRRISQLQTGAEVSRIAAMQTDPEQLVTRAVELIRERFDFYYVGLFLLDAANQFAILEHGSGEAGRIMKEQGHRLRVDKTSMVGWACSHKQARIALDVGQEAIRFANPLLPDTHSEMALPLRVGERVIGALDVQSTQIAAFDQQDVAVLQGVADLIAIALENARLFEQTRAALQELEKTNRLLVRQGWAEYVEQVSALRRAEFRAAQAPATGPLSKPLTIPLELRGQPIGRLTVRRESARPWTDDERQLVQAIAVQTTLAADNARLIEQTQRALRETEGLYQATRIITSAMEFEEICQNLAQCVNDLMQADRTVLFLINKQQEQILIRAGYGNLALDDLQMTYGELNRGISGKVIASGQPILSTHADDGIEPEETRPRRKQSGTGALIVAPLVAKGEVIGTITVLNREGQRVFTQHDVELVMALTSQATIAVENVRLFEQIRTALQETQGLYRAAQIIMTSTRIQDICQQVAQQFNDLVQAERTIVTLVDRAQRQILLRVGAGNIQSELAMSFEELEAGIGGAVMRSARAHLSLGPDDPNESEETRARRRKLNIGSLIVVPITIKGEVVGIASSHMRMDQRKLTQRDVELMTTMTTQAAVAIENVRLLEQAQRRAEREQLLRQITTRIRAAGDIQSILQTTAAELAQSLRVPRAVARLLTSADTQGGKND